MAINLVRCRGLTLIELMVATAIGLTVMMTLTTTFVMGSKTATRITENTYFHNEFSDIARFITDDIRRAGYSINGSNAGTVRWAGSTKSVAVLEAGSCIAYAYEFNDGGSPKIRYSSIYQPTSAPSDFVRLYTKVETLPILAANIPNETDACGSGMSGEAITDPNTFTVTELKFDDSSVPLINVTLKATSGVNALQDEMTFNVVIIN